MLVFLPLWLALMLLVAGCGSVAEAPDEATPQMQSAATDQPPAATPLPAADLLEQALARREIGDITNAAVDLSTLVNSYPDAPDALQARYYLAESFALRGHWHSAIESFRAFVNDPNAPPDLTAPALFWLARGYEEVGDWNRAIETFDRYRDLQTPLEPYAAARQAALWEALGQVEQAAQAYEYVATSSVQSGERAGSYEKAIAIRLQLGQRADALRLYTDLLELASLPGYRARLLAEAAALADSLGQTDQARAWLREITTTAPATPQAINAVEQLLAANDPALPAADAAQIYFSAEYYTAALPLFDEALAGLPPQSDEAVDLRRLRALALRAQGQFDEALDELAAAAAANPDSQAGLQARLDWIQTLGQSGEVAQAAQAYTDYSHTYSTDWRAPVALDRAIQLRARLGDIDTAMQIRLELGQRFPQSDQASAALNVAAWYYYNNQRYAEARSAWQQLADSGSGYEQARGAFWAGRIASSQQDSEQARALFETAYQADPDSYYGARAAEELSIAPQGQVPLDASIMPDEWQALIEWVDSWAQTDGMQPFNVMQEVAEGGYAQRASALHEVGLHREALGEWNSARDAWAAEPYKLVWLARMAYKNNIPYIALKTGEQLAALAPAEARPLPTTLKRLIYPAPYPELVQTAAHNNNIDPRLFYALLRQESLFNPGATSWVGARGLAQVMPSTGQGIAQNLGVTDFELDDLYRPQVSVRFGAFYIGQRIEDMQGSIHGGLAAYNGGLGNAQRWAGGSAVADADLFTEYIDYPETEEYVKRVYGFYRAYQRLYHLPQE